MYSVQGTLQGLVFCSAAIDSSVIIVPLYIPNHPWKYIWTHEGIHKCSPGGTFGRSDTNQSIFIETNLGKEYESKHPWICNAKVLASLTSVGESEVSEQGEQRDLDNTSR